MNLKRRGNPLAHSPREKVSLGPPLWAHDTLGKGKSPKVRGMARSHNTLGPTSPTAEGQATVKDLTMKASSETIFKWS